MNTTKNFEIYKCGPCGQVIEVLHAGSPSLVCCGEAMKKLVEGTSDGAKEKHVPVLEKDEFGCKVSVGSVAHPMTEEHSIEWIEVTALCGRKEVVYLGHGNPPEAKFRIPFERVATVREYCNLHGVWKIESNDPEACKI